MIRVGVLTSSRADFGIYLPLLKALQKEEAFHLELIVFGTHLSKFHGYTVEQIEREGFKIENGEITTPLRDVSLSGNILETLKNVDAIGNDFELSVGFCGKDGQTAPVGDGGPHTRILNALVGGSS